MAPVNPWLPSSPCDPDCLPPPVDAVGAERVRRALRATGRLTAVATVLGAGALVAVLAPLLAASTTARVQRRWALTLVTAAGLRLRLRHTGPGPTGPAGPGGGVLVVANHVSWLDVLALHAVAPVRMLAKREVRAWPLIGAMAARVGTVFLDRDRLRELPRAVDDLAEALAAGTPVGVFAEGTTRCGRDLGPFRPAPFQAAIDAGAPIQPVALAYRTDGVHRDDGADNRYGVDHTAAFVGDDTLWSSLWRVVTAPRLVLEVTVLPVLAPAGSRPGVDSGRAGPRRTLAARCAAAIESELALPALDHPVAVAHRAPRPAALPPVVGGGRADGADERALDRVA